MRSVYFDVLKGVAIIAVVLYHFGTCKYGYLGADVFLVIAGYFTIPSVDKHGYKGFALNRITRLLPLLLIAGFFSLILGIFLMLPDDLENLSQSIIATNCFSNNILQSITTGNYWAKVNEYKPLMHTWYVGLLMQFYVSVPFFYFLINKYAHGNRRIFIGINILIVLLSLFLYLFIGKPAEKFYHLPFRLFEFCAGSSVYLISATKVQRRHKQDGTSFLITAYLCLIFLLFTNIPFINDSTRLLTTVLTTSLLLYVLPLCKTSSNKLFSNRWVAATGMSCFSIFVWHQVILAHTRYSFTNDLTSIETIAIMLGILTLLSYFSYKYVEKMNSTKLIWTWISILFISTSGISTYLYLNAGVIRDVPELDAYAGNAKRGMWSEYCDRGYTYNKDFTSKDKQHWFIIGNSFGRDMVNIILESEIADRVEISYTWNTNLNADYSERFLNADVVFLSTLGLNQELIENVKRHCRLDCRFFIIGEKNFGECNGQVYRQRSNANYHDITVDISPRYTERNNIMKRLYSDIYVDMIEPVSDSNCKVRVFSDDGKFISQDCLHLTQAGARYYAKIIDWSRFLPCKPDN